MIRRFLSLFSAPSSEGAAPAPALLPAPDRGSTAWQVDHAHRIITVLRADFGRWRQGQSTSDPLVMAEEAEHAAKHLLLFAQQLRNATAPVVIPDSPEGLTGGEG